MTPLTVTLCWSIAARGKTPAIRRTATALTSVMRRAKSMAHPVAEPRLHLLHFRGHNSILDSHDAQCVDVRNLRRCIYTGMQRYLRRVGIGELLFGLAGQQIIDQLARRLWMRSAFDEQHRIGNDEAAKPAHLLIGVAAIDGLALFLTAVDVVTVYQG